MRSRHLMHASLVVALLLAAGPVTPARGPVELPAMALDGTWRVELDRADEGIQRNWWTRTLRDRIRLPGVLQAQGFGDEVSLSTPWMGQIVDRSFFESPAYEAYRRDGQVKVPFWLQPDKYYAGAAWYQRDIDMPAEWAGRRLRLTLERAHWQTVLWLDGKAIGSNDSLSTAHEYDLGTGVTPGPHVVTIRVDNRLVVDVGVNSHSVSDHTQGNWNGLVGRLEIRASDPAWIADLQTYPDVARTLVRVRGTIEGGTARSVTLRVTPGPGAQGAAAQDALAPLTVTVTGSGDRAVFEAEYPLGAGARTWDEFSPALYRLTASIDGAQATRAVTFGLREIGIDGTQFTINGRRAFLRGTLESAIFPATGHPPTDVDAWRRIIRIAKAHGLNHIRFHSWCPPAAAFEAADELGFYYQVEAGSWANQSTRLGIGLPVDDWVARETDRILAAYGNHPSFVLMAYGNEPDGRHEEYLAGWVARQRARDPRRLYTGAAGWPQIPANQFHVAPDPRIQAWGQELRSRVNAAPPETRTDYREYIAARPVPVVSHEIGQWCVYPNLAEVSKYIGYLKPKNFDIFRDRLRAAHMESQASAFLHASGKLQALLYKEDIEAALRTPGMAGFQLLDLHDFPGQGTALVGVLDPFWDSKGYITPEAYRRFAGPIVPLARLARRVFTTAETLEADVEVAQFGAAALPHAAPTWSLVDDDGRAVVRGTLPTRAIPVGNGTALGRVSIPLAKVAAPRRYRLVVGIPAAGAENDWDVWVYPPRVATRTDGVVLTNTLDDRAMAALASGGRVVLSIPPGTVRNDPALPVKFGFSSIFWNTAWTGRQAPTTLGLLLDPQHPAFASFPTDGYSNWQWWYIVTRAGAMILDGLPPDLRPTVQVIDDWFTARRLGLLFEARVNGGRLIVSSIDLETGLDANPVARQLRHSLLSYARSDRFAPTVTVTPEQVRGLIDGAR